MDVAAGMKFSIALRADSSIYCWGDNLFGQCSPPISTGISAVSTNCVSSIAAALLTDGRVISWGVCNYGSCVVPQSLGPASAVAVSGEATAAIVPLADFDSDEVPDAFDNCPAIANPTQADCNSDGIGDACAIADGAPDFDGDGVPDSCECIGDLFVDGQINGADLGALLSQWGPATAATASDLNRDGQVNGADLGYLLSGWGPCGN